MKKAIIGEKEFFENQDFFKNNLGFVYNFDNFEELKMCVKGRFELTHENFNKIRENRYQSIFNEFKNKYLEHPNKFFLSIVFDDKIYSIASFTVFDDYCYIDDVQTELCHRKHGLATMALKNGLSNFGDKLIKLDTEKTNIEAKSLYEKLGFTVAKEDNEKVFYEKSLNKQKLMEKFISK